MLDDATLLRRFAYERDEHAFAELVERHVNLVYSAALRQTSGDVHLAQDVAQSVFTDLARKARAVVKSLESGTPFVGWLYTSTRFASSSALRGEQRRRSRENIACIMNEGSNPRHMPQEPVWADLRPILDELMSTLSDLDRNAILLRYFEGKELREVGKVLGLSGEATRKRVARALQRLRYLLVRRGIKTPGSALAAVLAANAVQMAPREFARYLARLSLARAASVLTPVTTTHALLAIVTANAKIVTLLLVGILVIGVMASSFIRRSRTRPTSQRVDQTSSVRAVKVQESSSSPRPTFTPAPEDAALSKLRAALAKPGILPKYPSPEIQLAMLDLGAQREKALPILREALNDRTWEVRRRAVYALASFSWREPNLANALIPEIIQMLHDSGTGADAMASDAALQAAGIQPDSIPALLTILRENPVACSLAANSIFNLVKSDPEAARKVVEQLKPLKDSDPMIQEAARDLSVKLTARAPDDRFIIPLIDQLKTGDDVVKTEALNLLDTISISDFPVRASSALKEFLKQPNREDLKVNADEILRRHDPSYSKEREDPGLKQIQAAEELAFLDKARRGQATVHELAAALRLYPSAIPEAANALKAIGYDEMRRRSNESVQEMQDFSSVIMMLPLIIYGNEPFETRLAASDALRELQPARERLLYTVQEVAPAFDTIYDALPRLPEEKRVNVEVSFRLMVDLAQTRWNRSKRSGEITDYPGGDLRTFARQLGTADRTTFDNFVTAMRMVDPKFLQ